MENDLYIERCTEIEKANRILLEKMTNIMTTSYNPAPLNANPFKKSMMLSVKDVNKTAGL